MAPRPKSVRPDSYTGFEGASIEIVPLSKRAVKFEKYQLPKAFIAEFRLNDLNTKSRVSGNTFSYSKWFVRIEFEVSDHGTPEVLGIFIKGSTPTQDYEHFKTGLYEGYTKDARPVQKWQTDFVNLHLNQFILKANYEAIKKLKKSGTGWEIHHREELISKAESEKARKSLDNRIHESLTPDFIYEVAQIYSQAKAARLHPTKFVMEHYGIKRATASRWVRKAVDLKFLPEPESQGKSSRPNKKIIQPELNQKGR